MQPFISVAYDDFWQVNERWYHISRKGGGAGVSTIVQQYLYLDIVEK